jgi:hypothetical protein
MKIIKKKKAIYFTLEWTRARTRGPLSVTVFIQFYYCSFTYENKQTNFTLFFSPAWDSFDASILKYATGTQKGSDAVSRVVRTRLMGSAEIEASKKKSVNIG